MTDAERAVETYISTHTARMTAAEGVTLLWASAHHIAAKSGDCGHYAISVRMAHARREMQCETMVADIYASLTTAAQRIGADVMAAMFCEEPLTHADMAEIATW